MLDATHSTSPTTTFLDARPARLALDDVTTKLRNAEVRAVCSDDEDLINTAHAFVAFDPSAQHPETREAIDALDPILVRAETYPLVRRVKGYTLHRRTAASPWRSCSCESRKPCKHLAAADLWSRTCERKRPETPDAAIRAACFDTLLSRLDEAQPADLRASLTAQLALIGDTLHETRWQYAIAQYAILVGLSLEGSRKSARDAVVAKIRAWGVR